ncbi:hypothetical protein I312_105392 [Cryptococcus bacillisporus CA1280]|uniref:uncharacterized protein n=1 Tax=Cryptococcus bacillisporus CA1280 TaxID=1296109 RepID=UPI0033670969
MDVNFSGANQQFLKFFSGGTIELLDLLSRRLAATTLCHQYPFKRVLDTPLLPLRYPSSFEVLRVLVI